jgi:hypothetical protein
MCLSVIHIQAMLVRVTDFFIGGFDLLPALLDCASTTSCRTVAVQLYLVYLKINALYNTSGITLAIKQNGLLLNDFLTKLYRLLLHPAY